jgi:anti-sigma factor RsiW
MTCEWRGQLDRYVDSELSEPEMTRVDAHLRSCASCAADALARMRMKRSIHASATNAFVPSAEFRAQLSKQIGTSPKRALPWLPQFAFATALIAIVVVGISLWQRHSQRQNLFAEIADVHVATLASANPVDVVSTDRHTVKPWFEGKLPFTFNLPELQNTDFRLIGGRMAYIDQSPGAELLFGIRKHQISAFLFQDREGFASLSTTSNPTQSLNFNFETWSDHGLRYVVVSAASRGDVHALSNLLHSAGQ